MRSHTDTAVISNSQGQSTDGVTMRVNSTAPTLPGSSDVVSVTATASAATEVVRR